MKRKGVGAIVSIVLIMLLIIVGVSVLWAAVKPLIQKSTSQVQADCFTVNLKITSCTYASGNANVRVQRKVGSGDLTGLRFAFILSDGQTVTRDGLTNLPGELESGTFSSSLSVTPRFVVVSAMIGDEKAVCTPYMEPFACQQV